MKKQKLFVPLIVTFLTALIVISIFEVMKLILHQDITVLESYRYTILFFSIVATAGAYLIIRRKLVLLGQINEQTTQRNQADEMLQAIADSANDDISFWNPAAERMFGYMNGEAKGRNLHRLIAPQRFQPSYQTPLDRFLQTGQGDAIGSTIEVMGYHKSGHEISIELSLSAILLNEVWHAVGIVRDITSRKQSELMLRESEWKYRSLASTVDSMYLVDQDGRFLFVNDYYQKNNSPDGKSLVGRKYDELHGEEASRIFADAIKNVIETAEAYQDEWVVAANGKSVLRTFSPVKDANGIIANITVSSKDITQRKRLEGLLTEQLQLLKLATQAAEIGVWTWEFSTEICVWDERQCAIYAVPGDVLKTGLDYQFWRSRVHPEDVEQFSERLQEARYNGTLYTEEYRIVRFDGSIRNIYAAAVVDGDMRGKPIRLIGINRDITAQRELEASQREAKQKLEAANVDLTYQRAHLEELVQDRTRDLLQARDAAESANRAKSSFLASMSHELRTPLHHISGIGQLLADAVEGERPKKFVRNILSSSGQMLSLINNILDYSQIEADQLKIESSEFTLSTLLEQSENKVHEAMSAKRLQFVHEVEPGLPAWLKGDPIRIGQILDSLLSNAVKFSERGCITLRVRKVKAAGGNVTLRFAVEDQGMGITPEVQAGLFQVFNQGCKKLDRQYGGTGLGLALSKRLVSLMAGEIGVISNPGKGSTFWFTVQLPLGEAPVADTVETGPVDWNQAAAAVEDLEKLLADNDARAKMLWKKSRHLVEPVMHDRLAEFDAAVQGYDFKTALKLLREEVAAVPELSANH